MMVQTYTLKGVNVMDDKKINITESEWKIMQIIWSNPYSSLGEIKEKLDKIIIWDRTTVNTLLRRLKNKGVIGVKVERYNKYYALVTEEECLLEEMNSILDRLFYSSPKKLMATLVKYEKFSDEDLEEIKNLLNDIEEINK